MTTLSPPAPPVVPVVARPWSAARMPAFWLTSVTVGLAGLVVLLISGLMLTISPRAGALSALLVALYAAAWLTLLLVVVDPVERRPVWLVGLAVGFGGTIAVAVGAGSATYLDRIIGKAVSPEFAGLWGAALVAPTAEELAKVAGVVLLLLAARPYLATVWSTAVYGALVGLGFTLVEDFGYALTYADLALPDDVGAAAQLLALRFSLPGLVGHPLFTAVCGAGVGYAWLRTDRSRGRRAAVLAAALGAGWLAHFAVNSPLAAGATELLAALPGAGVWTGYLLTVGLASVPAVWWLARVRSRDARLVLGRAAGLAPGLLRPDELTDLTGPVRRGLAGLRVRRVHGPAAAEAARKLSHAQVRLAAALAVPYRGHPPALPAIGWYAPPVRHWWQETYQARLSLSERLRRTTAEAREPAPEPGRSGTAGTPDRVARWAAVLPLAGAALLSWPVAAVGAIGVAAVAWRHGSPVRRPVALSCAVIFAAAAHARLTDTFLGF